MADGVWKGVQPQVIGHFKQLSLNKFFDPSTPSMRKGRDKEKRKEQAGAELCQAQVKLEVLVYIRVKVVVENQEKHEKCERRKKCEKCVKLDASQIFLDQQIKIYINRSNI